MNSQANANVSLADKAKELIARVYRYNEVGGNLHVQLDDKNLEDEYFEEFKNYLGEEASKEQLEAEKECFDFLKNLSYRERAQAMGETIMEPLKAQLLEE